MGNLKQRLSLLTLGMMLAVPAILWADPDVTNDNAQIITDTVDPTRTTSLPEEVARAEFVEGYSKPEEPELIPVPPRPVLGLEIWNTQTVSGQVDADGTEGPPIQLPPVLQFRIDRGTGKRIDDDPSRR